MVGCCHQCCGTDAVVAQRASTRSTVPSGHCAVKLYHSTYSRYWAVLLASTYRARPCKKGVPGGSPCRIWRNFRDDVERTSLGYTLAQYWLAYLYVPAGARWHVAHARKTCAPHSVCATDIPHDGDVV